MAAAGRQRVSAACKHMLYATGAEPTANLKAPRGQELLKALAKKVDVLVENFAARVMERLGLGYNVLRPLNPRLIDTTVETSLYDAAVGALLGLKPTELAVLQEQGIICGEATGPARRRRH